MISELNVEAQIVENVLEQLENEFSEKVTLMNPTDKVTAAGTLNQINMEEERESIRKNIENALSTSNQTQRIYFIVRSMIMTVLGAIITLAIFWQLGTINLVEDFVLGISTYVICLIISRLFDRKIVNISKTAIAYLGEHRKLRTFILRNF